MRINNAQLRLLIPVVLVQARENPSIEWDLLLENLIECAYSRRSSIRPEDVVPKELLRREGEPALHITGVRAKRDGRPSPAESLPAGHSHPLLDGPGPKK